MRVGASVSQIQIHFISLQLNSVSVECILNSLKSCSVKRVYGSKYSTKAKECDVETQKPLEDMLKEVYSPRLYIVHPYLQGNTESNYNQKRLK